MINFIINFKIRFFITCFWEVVYNILNNMGLYSRLRPDPSASLSGQTVIVTGANRGIGKYLALDCAKRGARVIMGCRDIMAAQRTASEIKRWFPSAQLAVYQVDLSSYASIKNFASKIMKNEEKLDVLINNAGMCTGVERKETLDGHEQTMGVNYFGSTFLTLCLLDKLIQSGQKFKSASPRVVFVSSVMHDGVKIDLNDLDNDRKERWFLNPYIYLADAYAKSKAFLTMFAYQLAKRSSSYGLKVYAVDPGVSPTDINREIPGVNTYVYQWIKKCIYPFFARTPEESASSVMYAVLRKDNNYAPEHCYLYDGEPFPLSKQITDPIMGEKLWLRTQRIFVQSSIQPIQRETTIKNGQAL